MKIKKSVISLWLPMLITVVCAIVTSAVYTATAEEISVMLYLQIFSTVIVAAALPVLGLMTKREFPAVLNCLIVIHSILSVNLGSVLSFYERFPYLDTVLHGCFGFLAGAVLSLILLGCNGDRLRSGGFLFFVFLATMGCAALWEMFEFTSDLLLNSDAQRVQESVSRGLSPVHDTMIDIAITAVGAFAFCVSLTIDRLFGGKLSKLLYKIEKE